MPLADRGQPDHFGGRPLDIETAMTAYTSAMSMEPRLVQLGDEFACAASDLVVVGEPVESLAQLLAGPIRRFHAQPRMQPG